MSSIGAKLPRMRPQLLTMEEAADVLNVSASQMYALLRRGEIRALQLGGRGQWRIDPPDLDAYIESSKQRTEAEVRSSTGGTTTSS
jgi:excisionase family DNA binding protein